ncbi:protein Wnt-6-like [Rhopilema esculentum]|uniref:protein Wnt-6-like n=1 Tax=Rhopilema esculentum TaxID=499914 RepID=UPI0031DEB5A5
MKSIAGAMLPKWIFIIMLLNIAYGILRPRNPFQRTSHLSVCMKFPAYLRRNTQLCESVKETMLGLVLLNGTRMAILECQKQFRSRRWNCSHDTRSIEAIVSYGYKEVAYLFAIQSAGVAHAITTGCHMGMFANCQCKSKKKRRQRKLAKHEKRNLHYKGNIYDWSDHCLERAISYGKGMSRKVMRNDKVRDVRGLVDRHNKEAGRLALTSMELGHQSQCKCHGISGACHLKTCVRKLPDFRDIGRFLLQKYDSAVKVMIDNKGTKLLPKEKSFEHHTSTDLVYTDDSPDFCKANVKTGSMGTSGRRCVPGDGKLNSCSILCCDKGEEKSFVILEEHCNCTFQYCCDVHCEICRKNVTSYTCK